jgi:hypothetical protein
VLIESDVRITATLRYPVTVPGGVFSYTEMAIFLIKQKKIAD